MSRYSARVRTLRIAMPLAALLLIVSIFAWPFVENMSRLKFEGVNKNADQLTIVKPHYAAKDSNKNPFEITADRAIQKTAQPDIVHLENPEANIAMDNHQLVITATSGVYNKKGGNLALRGAVNLKRDDGVDIKASDTDMDLGTGSATSVLPVDATSPDTNVKDRASPGTRPVRF